MFLGVDGGGTKTAFALIDDTGRVLARHSEGPCYYLASGLEPVADMLGRGTLAVLGKAGLRAGDVQHAFFGIPAYGEDSVLQPQLDALPAGVLPPAQYHCGNDVVCGWAGSLAARDGIHIVCGTGSIVYGVRGEQHARAGGWGELFSDEGSAYWIAREGLSLFSRMSDGRQPRGPLHAVLRRHFDLAHDLDLCGCIYTRLGAGRDAVAQLAQQVAAAAQQGDEQARAIFERAAAELAEMAAAVRQALGGDALHVSYSGGVFDSGDLVLAPLRAALVAQGGDTLVAPRFTPDLGAALFAAKLAGRPLSDAALARLG